VGTIKARLDQAAHAPGPDANIRHTPHVRPTSESNPDLPEANRPATIDMPPRQNDGYAFPASRAANFPAGLGNRVTET